MFGEKKNLIYTYGQTIVPITKDTRFLFGYIFVHNANYASFNRMLCVYYVAWN